MYTNSGYLYSPSSDREDLSRPLIVESCGFYRLLTRPAFTTCRPLGRRDYQLIYLASGRAHFSFQEREEVLGAGHMVLCVPGEPQKYSYFAQDKPEIYWVHFTGSAASQAAASWGLTKDCRFFCPGTSPDYPRLFCQMIRELQVRRPCFEELLSLLLEELFLRVRRQLLEAPRFESRARSEMEAAAHFFAENFHRPICIADYAAALHLSPCWFIRSFKEFSGMTPARYLTSLRISNAQSLLENSGYNVGEIAAIVGYENPLYFSRIFKKQTGLSPSQYRQKLLTARQSSPQ